VLRIRLTKLAILLFPFHSFPLKIFLIKLIAKPFACFHFLKLTISASEGRREGYASAIIFTEHLFVRILQSAFRIKNTISELILVYINLNQALGRGMPKI
jgi:hypothetical protein